MVFERNLPNIARVLDDGRWSSIHPPDIGSAAAWPSFLTGGATEDLPLFGEWIWDPTTMEMRRIPETFEDTFVRRLHDDGVRVGLFDLPFAPEMEWPNGFFVGEWGVHHRITGRLWISPNEAREVVDGVPRHPYFGINLRPDDPHDVPKLRATAEGSIEGVRQRGRLARRLFERFPVDLAFVAFQEIHHAGHYLWHATEPDHPLYADIPESAKSMGDPVRATLVETDRVIGALVEQLRPTSIALFALNGMEPYRGTPDVLGRILRDRGHAVPAPLSKKQALIAALRKHAPGWLREIYHRSTSRESQLEGVRTSLLGSHDWQRTGAFSLPPEEWTPLQVNLRGREAAGHVSPGPDYEALVDELEALAVSMTNKDGRSAIRKVIRAADPSRDWPDVLVHWEHTATYPPGSLAGAPDYEMLFHHHTAHHLPLGFCISNGDIAGEMEDDMTTAEFQHPIVTAASASVRSRSGRVAR